MMKRKERLKENKAFILTGKECAYAAIFVALILAAQLALSAVPGVEVVTLLFVVYAFTMGAARGMICATAFSLIRQLVFGFYPTVLILYLIYYNFLCVVFGFLGKCIQNPFKQLWLLVGVACICTMLFTVMDCMITLLWNPMSERAAELYFKASLSVMLPQIVCTALTVGVLFLPLKKVLSICIKK
jgi:hypothetical protein